MMNKWEAAKVEEKDIACEWCILYVWEARWSTNCFCVLLLVELAHMYKPTCMYVLWWTFLAH